MISQLKIVGAILFYGAAIVAVLFYIAWVCGAVRQ